MTEPSPPAEPSPAPTPGKVPPGPRETANPDPGADWLRVALFAPQRFR